MNLRHGPLRDIIETVILALLVFLLVREGMQNFQVEGSSMVPTVSDNDFVVVNKLSYKRLDIGPLDALAPGKSNGDFLFGGPGRGDIVVFQSPSDLSRDFVKRVIGLPGDVVEIRSGSVLVNGEVLDDTAFTNGPLVGDTAPTTVPPEHYYVLGDNRNASLDSRSFGPIHERLIVGKCWFRWLPLNQIGGCGSEDIELVEDPSALRMRSP